ncbi:hypothetical protein SCHPADRAFT_944313 [Schizopora paradoxa]|uniref:Uncharacterized protein n=1 Tax=Schizopora paradoxa TaxID=27342 RepID=A0A0H2RUX5_9AGAM|nr:hypothetical protein SCHPADRAFT_944313 [Schizopora paradoxa]
MSVSRRMSRSYNAMNRLLSFFPAFLIDPSNSFVSLPERNEIAARGWQIVVVRRSVSKLEMVCAFSHDSGGAVDELGERDGVRWESGRSSRRNPKEIVLGYRVALILMLEVMDSVIQMLV